MGLTTWIEAVPLEAEDAAILVNTFPSDWCVLILDAMGGYRSGKLDADTRDTLPGP